jgi:lysophospholipase L1-like esterase
MRRNAFIAGLVASMAAAPARAAGGVRIVALGDSLALGTGASRSDGGFIFRAYRNVLRAHPGSMLDTFAIGGSIAADVVRLQVPRLRSDPAGIVIVCVGGNDVVRETPPATFARTYATLIADVRAAAPQARIICCGVPDVAVSPIFADERAAVHARAIADDDAVRATARAAHAAFVDLFGVTRARRDDRGFICLDRFDTWDSGYGLLAAALTPVLLADASRGAARFGTSAG